MTTLAYDVSADERELLWSPRVSFGYARTEATVASYRARPTLSLKSRHEGGRWLIEECVTGIFGQGADALDAVNDFRRALREHLEVLERQPALSDALQFQLEYLRAHT
jgi:hypothetical protein